MHILQNRKYRRKRTVIKSGQIANSLSSFPLAFNTAFKFSFSNSTQSSSSPATPSPPSRGMEERMTSPRVKPFETWRVTEMILPVKSSVPFSDLISAVIGSSFKERARAIERPIVHATNKIIRAWIAQWKRVVYHRRKN